MIPTYEDEDKIIWLKDRDALARMNYVREKWQLCRIRTGPVKAPSGEMLIGYVVLKRTAAKAEENGFCRRIFILLPEDRFCDSEGAFRNYAPPEAVDLHSVQAGKPSRRII
jgi:hypothetical protein